MARILPTTLGTETPESERKVHSILKLGLSDDWIVVHSVAWQGLPGESRPPEDRRWDAAHVPPAQPRREPLEKRNLLRSG